MLAAKRLYCISPRPDFRILPVVCNSLSTLSSTPFMKVLLFDVLYTFDNSMYSLMVTLTGILGKLSNSQIAIRINNVSSRAMRSASQFWVFAPISC